MSDTGKQSPLGVNTLSSLLQNIGFNINPIMITFTGSSTSSTSATQLGKIVNETLKYHEISCKLMNHL